MIPSGVIKTSVRGLGFLDNVVRGNEIGRLRRIEPKCATKRQRSRAISSRTLGGYSPVRMTHAVPSSRAGPMSGCSISASISAESARRGPGRLK